MTASEINMNHSNETRLGIVSRIIDDLQNKVSLRTIKTIPDLLQAMTQAEALPGVPHEDLSVVYRDYGQSQCEWVVHHGEPVNEATQIELAADNKLIFEGMDQDKTQPYIILNGADECDQHGFPGYQSVLIVAMRLDDHKRIGAFIIHHRETPGAYDQALGRVFDVLSDRLALLIRIIQQRLRETEGLKFKRDLSKKAQSFERECQILDATLTQLRQWYKHDLFYILIKNPLDTVNYYLVNDIQDEIHPGFRSSDTLEKKDLYAIVGSEQNLATMTEIDFQYAGAIINLPDPSLSKIDTESVNSWLGATIYHHEGVILGHIVLHNNEAKYAYGEEDARLLSDICDTAGNVLSTLRQRQKTTLVDGFENTKDQNKLYQDTLNYLKAAYGVHSLLVYQIKTATQDWDIAFQNGIFTTPEAEFRQRVIDVAQSCRIRNSQEDVKEKQSIEFPVGSGDKYLVVPMRTRDEDGDFRVVGCFVIPAQNQGIIATRIIDEVSDALAERQKNIDDDQRQEKLNQFIKEVSQLSPNNLTTEQSLRLAEKAIKEIMFSANLYFALYDQKNNVISFPVIYKNGRPWEDIKERPLDIEQQGRTEAIILDGQSILIKTSLESESWYSQPGRKDHAGNPLVSWVGVPFFDDKGVRGVIAVYHPDLEYVYSKKDLHFLEMVAGEISTLFRMVELKESNKNTENVVTQEGQILNNLLAIDVTHRLKGSLGSVSANIVEAKALAEKLESSTHYEEATQIVHILSDVEETTFDLLKSVKDITTTDSDTVNITAVILEVIRQITIEFRIPRSLITQIIPDREVKSKQNGRLFFTIVYSILQNACQALINTTDDAIEIILETNQSHFDLIIKDNGTPISEIDEKSLFKLNFSTKENGSGYALWRAKTYAKKLGGDLDFYREGQFKCFKLTMPTIESAPIAYVIDDERIWRNSLARWLSNMGYRVKTAGTLEEAHSLFSQSTDQVNLVLLDVSMNYNRGTNADGLTLIKPIKTMSNPSPKIILVTGYSGTAKWYSKDVDGLIDKVDDDGIPLSNVIFKEKIDKIINTRDF